MAAESYWQDVAELRLRIADLLESLDEREWESPSLCADWRVRDLAGHLASVPTVTVRQMLAAAPRARFDINKINTAVAVRYGARPRSEIIESIRAHAHTRTAAPGLSTANWLFDLAVHSQDIAVPLGRDFEIPSDVARRSVERVWAMGWPFKAPKRLAGLTLRATDSDWNVGSGPAVEGSTLALLLVLTGRADVVRTNLSGDGAASIFVPR